MLLRFFPLALSLVFWAFSQGASSGFGEVAKETVLMSADVLVVRFSQHFRNGESFYFFARSAKC